VPKTKYAKFKCPNCRKMLTHIHQVHNCRAMPPFKKLGGYPFGGVEFNPARRQDGEEVTNGERAEVGHHILALSCVIGSEGLPCASSLPPALEVEVEGVNLTEAPEDALTDLLASLMHYCHREKIDWFGTDGVSQRALRHFSHESGGAVL
jgi:hypothetical protein